MCKEHQRIVPQEIKEAFGQWAVPFILGCVPQIAWFQAVRDFLKRLGWESVVWAMSALLAALVWHVIAHRKLARQIEKLKDELDQDVEHSGLVISR